MKKIPTRLGDCPIIESVLEIRFDSDFDRNVVFPMLYSSISADFQPPTPLPILQIPDTIKAVDPNYNFQPYYRLVLKECQDISLQIGPGVIAFSFSQHYAGWHSFRNYVTKYVDIFKGIGVIKKVIRMGFRVINFFDWDIYHKGLELRVSLAEQEIPYSETALKTKFFSGAYESTVNILNCANLNNQFGQRTGSVIDIDTYTIHCDNFFDNILQYMDEAHSVEKSLFFTLLTDEQIIQFKPTYDVID